MYDVSEIITPLTDIVVKDYDTEELLGTMEVFDKAKIVEIVLEHDFISIVPHIIVEGNRIMNGDKLHITVPKVRVYKIYEININEQILDVGLEACLVYDEMGRQDTYAIASKIES